jgi:hypothetical protein
MSTLAVKVVLDTRRALIKNAGSKDPIYPMVMDGIEPAVIDHIVV